jgi:two-component system sensor histidine kinase PhoQ
LLEVLGNLLENACKYGAGKVQLRARQLVSNKRKPGLLLSVGNNGEPLSGAQFERLLQRGQRGDERIDGDGLGLAIVCEIADAYQARLYSRRSELGGLEVVLEFP